MMLYLFILRPLTIESSKNSMQVVLLPVLLGASMSHFFPSAVSKISPIAPTVAVITIAAICASAIAQNASAIVSSGFQVLVAVVALHAAGFLFGYMLSKLLGFEESTFRTISFEVGMQNSVLGVVLAGQHFGNPLTAVPCAISSVCHSVFGSILAGIWRMSSKLEVPRSGSMLMTESS
ncbi:hypothetical protein O6H91_01G150400 [Diphasiastrum complanatum]|uniref:Uncharacterized protein n=1 Tax=Diphasiastrum complanatum TaxID=34168 RepID=A0ACC2EXH8_DIPCM|nr:hypothetical protein O6H91_01G150400 [Diphasiastrum complanatum]